MEDLRMRILSTGGTIDKVYFDEKSTFEVGDPQIAEVLKHAQISFEYTLQALMRKDSLELTPDDRALIRAAVERAPEERILVTHGTDTMTETARALEGIAGKTVVLTGSLVPARFRENDAIFNIGFALAAVQTLDVGVYIAMHGQIYRSGEVEKNRELNRFVRIDPGSTSAI